MVVGGRDRPGGGGREVCAGGRRREGGLQGTAGEQPRRLGHLGLHNGVLLPRHHLLEAISCSGANRRLQGLAASARGRKHLEEALDGRAAQLADLAVHGAVQDPGDQPLHPLHLSRRHRAAVCHGGVPVRPHGGLTFPALCRHLCKAGDEGLRGREGRRAHGPRVVGGKAGRQGLAVARAVGLRGGRHRRCPGGRQAVEGLDEGEQHRAVVVTVDAFTVALGGRRGLAVPLAGVEQQGRGTLKVVARLEGGECLLKRREGRGVENHLLAAGRRQQCVEHLGLVHLLGAALGQRPEGLEQRLLAVPQAAWELSKEGGRELLCVGGNDVRRDGHGGGDALGRHHLAAPLLGGQSLDHNGHKIGDVQPDGGCLA
mmetsp:Transcript_40076/g.113523  ORF Transcript_40076/g.113523 Transcript_40076/m.113523 type:complete len:371 (-) Transcript_40076:3867-4979(-)